MNTIPLEYILLATSALFVSVNPLAVPAFLSMTEAESPHVRARIAASASIAAGIVLVFFALAGTGSSNCLGSVCRPSRSPAVS